MAEDVATAYRVLGLKPGATPEQVKRAYRNLIKRWHPDRILGDERLQSRAHAKAAELNAAYARVQEHLRKPPARPEPAQHAPASAPRPSKQAQSTRPCPAPTRPPTRPHRQEYAQDLAIVAKVLGTVALFPALLAGIAVAMTRLVTPDVPAQAIAMGLSFSSLLIGPLTVTMASVALLGLPGSKAALQRRVAVKGLILGGISVIAGAAVLWIEGLNSR